jgi:nitrite reductase/ring-hydroxylating ferredoxin subunit
MTDANTETVSPPAAAYAICAVGDIPNRRTRGFHLLRRDPDGTDHPWHIVVIRWDRKLYAYANVCPHQGVHLDWEREQFLDGAGERLVCGKHGAMFDVATGECVDGPCRGDRLEPVRLSVLDGDICVVGVELTEDDDEDDEAPSMCEAADG